MGLDIDAERKAQGLAPLPKASTPEPLTHHDPEVEDATIGNEERLRGIPAVGRVAGTIKGTRPGDSAKHLDDEARELNEHGRLIIRGQLKRTRRNDHHDDRIKP